MPTYLTPGVYVEEVPSANKPIEGVSTSIAAFVGLAPGRPGQHADADLELDPVREDLRRSERARQRPVHGGRVPRALASTASSRTAAACAGSSASATTADGAAARRAPRCRPRPTRPSRPSARSRSRASTDAVTVEIAEEPGTAGEGRRRRPTSSSVTRGAEQARSSTGLTLKKGRTNLATKVNAASKLIKIEETGASLPEAQRVPATGTLHAVGAVASTRRRSSRRTSRATSPAARAWAASPRSTRSRWS